MELIAPVNWQIFKLEMLEDFVQVALDQERVQKVASRDWIFLS